MSFIPKIGLFFKCQYKYKVNLSFLANASTPDQVNIPRKVTARYLPMKYYTRTEVYADIAWKKKSAEYTALTGEKA